MIQNKNAYCSFIIIQVNFSVFLSSSPYVCTHSVLAKTQCLLSFSTSFLYASYCMTVHEFVQGEMECRRSNAGTQVQMCGVSNLPEKCQHNVRTASDRSYRLRWSLAVTVRQQGSTIFICLSCHSLQSNFKGPFIAWLVLHKHYLIYVFHIAILLAYIVIELL